MRNLHEIMIAANQSGDLHLSVNSNILYSNWLRSINDPDSWSSRLTSANTDLQWNYDLEMDQKR